MKVFVRLCVNHNLQTYQQKRTVERLDSGKNKCGLKCFLCLSTFTQNEEPLDMNTHEIENLVDQFNQTNTCQHLEETERLLEMIDNIVFDLSQNNQDPESVNNLQTLLSVTKDRFSSISKEVFCLSSHIASYLHEKEEQHKQEEELSNFMEELQSL